MRNTIEDRQHPQYPPTTVLLVEDDEVVRRLTRMILEDTGYRVLSAEDGSHAARLNRSFQGEIDLLLSDIMLPGGNGVEWAQRLRRDRPGMSALFMSAYSRDALREEGVPDPGSRLLRKPVRPDLLIQTIREILNR
jgi:CheY-like chemotaxis protein